MNRLGLSYAFEERKNYNHISAAVPTSFQAAAPKYRSKTGPLAPSSTMISGNILGHRTKITIKLSISCIVRVQDLALLWAYIANSAVEPACKGFNTLYTVFSLDVVSLRWT